MSPKSPWSGRTRLNQTSQINRTSNRRQLMPEKPEISVEAYRQRSRRSLLTGGVAAVAGLLGWRWVQNQPETNNIPNVLRNGHELNESLWTNLFRDDHQARTFDRDSASILRLNGRIGLRSEIDLDNWQLTVKGPDGTELGRHVLADIQRLPYHEMTIEHKCIEGWAQITNWGGARFSDFMRLYESRLPDNISHVYLETPDGQYYVSRRTTSRPCDHSTSRHCSPTTTSESRSTNFTARRCD